MLVKLELSMYPNPVSDILRIESSESSLFTFQLFNVAGERVSQNKVMSDSFELNVSEIPKGHLFYYNKAFVNRDY